MSASTPNLFMLPWFPRDFLAATRGWRLIPRAIYRELLDAQWDQGGLPANPDTLRSMIGATPAEWRAGWVHVQSKFPIGADGLRRNKRLEEHRKKAFTIALKRAEIGRHGGIASGARRQANAKQLLQSAGSNWSSNGQPSTQHNSSDAYEDGAGVLGECLQSAEGNL